MSVSGSEASGGLNSSIGGDSYRAPPPGNDGGDDTQPSFEQGVFGTLFTVSKEKHYSMVFVAFRLFMDWIQTFLILVSPAFGWDINPGNKLWQVFSFIQLNAFMSARGYTFFLACMYTMAVALAANVVLCVWVANSFGNNKFDYVWPIVVLRYFSLVFYQVLDIASLTLFLMTMDCQYFPGASQGYNQEFPDVYCWQVPHLIHVAVAALSMAVFFVLASLFTMGEIELNPVSHNVIGIGHTRVETQGFAVRMLMTCISVFISNSRWMSVLQLASALLLCWLYLRWLPHQVAVVNYLRVGFYFTVLWAALLFIVLAFQPGVDPDDPVAAKNQQEQLTIALWVGFVPFGMFGAYLAHLHTRYYTITVADKFRNAPQDTPAKRIHKFSDPRELEIAGRVVRRWVEEDVLDPDAEDLGERIFRAGMQLMPYEPFVNIWWSSFLIDVQGSYQSGYSELQRAKKLPRLSFLERFAIFIREQEHTQKASAASSGENSNVDLVSYVEFQRNYRLTLRLHMDALIAKRVFWETLLHNKVSFGQLSGAVQRIEATARACERMYKQVLARHSSSVKILVLYVKFLQYMRNDPWSAAKWSAEAEKLQKQEEEQNERTVLGEGQGQTSSGFDDESKAIIIMGANCLMRMANEPAIKILGYSSKSELVGRNINVIVPPPFSAPHNSYVRNYIDTGVAKILDRPGDVVMVHRDRYVVPVRLLVTKVSGIGEDSVFMGVFQQLPSDEATATVWVMTNGQVLSCDRVFTDWLGYKQGDLHGKPFKDLVVQQQQLEELLARMKHDAHKAAGHLRTRRSSQVILHGGDMPHSAASVTGPLTEEPPRPTTANRMQSVNGYGGRNLLVNTTEYTLDDIDFRHLYLMEEHPLDVRVSSAGLGDQVIHVFKLKRKDNLAHHLLVVDPKGRVCHATEALAARLGTTASKLQAGNMMHAIDALLPAPFVKLHTQHLRARPDDAHPPPWSCMSGLTMMLNATTKRGTEAVPFSMQIRRMEEVGREPLSVVHLEERSLEYALDERRLQLVINSQGIVRSASNSPRQLFSMDPQALLGGPMAYIVDVLRPEADPGNPNPAAVLDQEEQAAKVLMAMAQRSSDNPGISWRVGVSPIMDPLAVMALGPMAKTMLDKETVPAVMLVTPFMERPAIDGARAVLQAEMLYKVELWRADLLSGVFEVDTAGVIKQAGLKDQPIFNPHLLLGLPPSLLTGIPMSHLLPVNGKQLLDALFTEGGLAPQKAAKGPTGGQRTGGLRSNSTAARKRGMGPLHTVKLTHGTDGLDMTLQVQGVVKQDMGHGCHLYVIMHLQAPRAGRPDFCDWVWSSRPAADAKVVLTGLVQAESKPGSAFEPSKSLNLSQVGREQHKSISDTQLDPAPPKILGGPPIATFRKAKLKASFDDDLIMLAKTGLTSQEGAAEDQVEASGISNASSLAIKAVPDAVDNWVMSTTNTRFAGDATPDNAGPPSEPSSVSDGEDDEAGLGADGKQAADEVDEDNEMEDVDEAGAMMSDLQRGKRLKRLVRVMTGPQAQLHNKRLKYVSMVMAITLVVVEMAMFITFVLLTNAQVTQVQDLRLSATASSRVMQMVIHSSALGNILVNKTSPTLRHFGAAPPQVDLDYTKHLMRSRLDELQYLHKGMYRGFHKQRQLPDAFGLRDLWDKATLPGREYYKQADTVTGENVTFSTVVNMSLWRMGNEYMLSAANFLQNLETNYGFATNKSKAVLNDTDYLYVLYNGPRSLVTAYESTLDGLMQSAIRDSQQVNNVQLVVLGVQGVLVGCVTTLMTWYMASKVVSQRFTVYSVFLRLPQGVVRTQASQVVTLVEGEGEGDGEGDRAAAEEDDVQSGVGAGGGGGLDAEKGNPGKIGLAYRSRTAAEDKKDAEKQSWLHSLLALLPWTEAGRARRQQHSQQDNGKRQLQPSYVAVFKLTWPFLFWSVFIILISAMGFMKLHSISAPIAMSNLVQFVCIRTNKVLLDAMRMVSDTQLDSAKGYVTTGDFMSSGNYTHHIEIVQIYRKTLTTSRDLLLKEYDAMLYGRASTTVANLTAPDPHFELAKEGVMFSQGASYLFNYQGCMCEDPGDCLTPSAPAWPYVAAGLDAILTHFFREVDALLLVPAEDVYLNVRPFKFIFEVGMSDLNGGLENLIDVYSKFVVASYRSVVTLHIIALVVVVMVAFIFIVFIQRPAYDYVGSESKRMAELLAQLPAELDVEVMVADALRSCNALGPAAAAAAAASGMTRQQSSAKGVL